ncbi:hypothetical protein CONPUDRAFT_142055 [Coniophora puteana RWD-64-598 SS2]|uniref:F-box domain-containing protein n=1 Tax=Coniophora puteana (strain RWD-64-598) TaxID=741705 RepID=A0A5M3N2M0_CONPW|nr:uncharacterized protein CONPUDRAFT_142055 [Coniophora puteana RWD-64-598 SS2]EIW85527.1 hypothetical protein CONPUDRAFT_142055 [Coniophora puteana RWD-64-598 SS2]
MVHSYSLSFLRVLLGPSLEAIVLYPGHLNKHLFTLAATMGVLCPRMKDFTWMSENPSAEEEAVISKLITSWPKLEDVTSFALDKDALQYLSSLPSLKSITVAIRRFSTPWTFHVPAFPNATSLKLVSPSTYTLSDIASFVGSLRASPAHFSAIAETAHPTSVSDLFEAIAGHLDKAKLETLSVNEKQSPDSLRLDMNMLKRIFHFRCLTRVHVDTYREVDLGGGDLLEMADAWPGLISFSINVGWGWRCRSRVTLRDVKAMLQRLPKLEMLALAVDCETVGLETLGDEQYGRFRVEREVEVQFLDSRIGTNFADIAAFLSDLFPGIEDRAALDCWSLPSAALEGLSKMHRALLIAEVAHAIAFHQLSKKDLVALARTCRLFCDPALDALWAELNDITPLLDCLPDGCIEREETIATSCRYHLRGPLTIEAWTTLRKYSSRVKIIDNLDSVDPYEDTIERIVNAEVLFALSCPPFSEHLFPKLQRLSWKSVFQSDCPLLRIMLGPSLRSLKIVPGHANPVVLGLAAITGVTCPNLQEFTFMHSTPSLGEEALISQVITSWRNLESLGCCALTDQAWFYLSTSPSLKKLSMNLRELPSRLVLHDPSFCNLDELRLLAPPGQSLSSIVSIIRATHWRPVEFLGGAYAASTDSISDLFSVLVSHFDKARLKCLRVDERDNEPGWLLGRGDLEHAFKFRNLSTVCINTHREVTLGGPDLLAMADAWPNLGTLQINDDWGWRVRSTVTLPDVRAMLRRLPKLEMISLAVDCETAELNTLSDEQYGKFRVERPFQAQFLDSRIGGNLADIAAFLSDLFPGIEDRAALDCWSLPPAALGGMRQDYEDYSERWDNMIGIMLTINQIKRLEKKRISEPSGLS